MARVRPIRKPANQGYHTGNKARTAGPATEGQEKKPAVSAAAGPLPWGALGLVGQQAVGEDPDEFDSPGTGNWGQGHLGFGVFYEDLAYGDRTLSVTLFQAACGDTNGDRSLNSLDIQAILSANAFPDVQPADWPQADFNGDGWCNGLDIQAILPTGLYPFLPGPYAAVEPGQPPDGIVDLLLDPATGSLTIDTDGVTINGYVIRTAAGIFTGQAANNVGWFVEDCDDRISGNMGITITGEHWLGDVIRPEWLIDVNPYEDLTFTYTIAGTPGTFVGNLIVVPEPSIGQMLLVGMVGLLAYGLRRRH